MNITELKSMKVKKEKIAVLTCYDSTFACVLESCNIDCILVGDSLGMVIKGDRTTLTVTLEETIYHLRSVCRNTKKTFVIVDMPFSTFQQNPQETFKNAAKLMENGAHMIKVEGGSWLLETVDFLSTRGIPVCTHIGMLPQAIHKIGNYKKFGKTVDEYDRLIQTSVDFENAGSELIVLELVEESLSDKITNLLKIPTIGIGSGTNVDGQVLVLYDILGIGNHPRFAKDFLIDSSSIKESVENFIKSVKNNTYP
jgi:3-methyl-2-oxobutanoate hydroxymethyltransferase